MKRKLKMLSILLIIMLIIPFYMPIISNAAEIDSQAEEGTMMVTLKRDEINSNQINILATDTTYNIEELKYVHKDISLEEISYFEENNSDVYTFSIVPSQSVNANFMLDGYGTYTVYAKNSNGDRFLSRLTVHNPAEAPDLTVTKDDNNPLKITIQAISDNSTISIIKIAKINDINQDIDFETQGTQIEFAKSNNVNLEYEVNEEGLYKIYVKDENGASVTKQIFLSEKQTPIDINITDLGNREINIKASDSICNIVKIKYAKSSEINDFDDFETKGEEIKITEGKNIDINYTLQEDGTYTFLIEDEAGFRVMTTKRIVSSEENPMSITIVQDKQNKGNLTITATDTLSNIIELKVALGENLDSNYFENNGESLKITPGREVTANYNVNENCTITVYIKDEDGYSYMLSKNIIGIDQPTKNTPPEINLVQNTNNPKQIDVTVSDIDNYIDTIKWAEGSQNKDYFLNNGTRIGEGQLGKIIKTNFTIDSVGTYTVFAEDEEGLSTVKEINISSIDEVENEDTTPPSISNVTNGGIYNTEVTPNITDENLLNVILTKNGETVQGYQNGNIISEEGNYVLIATDVSGNESKISFTIDLTAPEIEILQENIDTQNVAVTINVKDNLTEIDIVKIAKGEQEESYFETNGQQIDMEKNNFSAEGRIKLTENGVYTIYTKDLAGNVKIQNFEVNTIDEDSEPEPEPEPEPEVDTTPPTINITKELSEDKLSLNLKINAIDDKSQIKTVKIADGERDITYFEGNGTEIQMVKDDKISNSLVNITENGIYTIYVEDEANNKNIQVVEITEIENIEPEPEPDPTPDITPPEITGVEDGKTYNNYVTPSITDENLSQVILTKDGVVAHGYKNGDKITENGNYVLTAIDEEGNKTEVNFIINIEQGDNDDDTNTTNNTNNIGNETDDTNTNVDNNEIKKPVGNNNSSVNGNHENSQNNNMLANKLPYAGIRNLMIFVIIGLTVIAVFFYKKYKNYRNI